MHNTIPKARIKNINGQLAFRHPGVKNTPRTRRRRTRSTAWEKRSIDLISKCAFRSASISCTAGQGLKGGDTSVTCDADEVSQGTITVFSCTIICKISGLFREVLLTSLFGIGPVMDAFTYASIIPTYFQSVVGGMNGPFHTAILVSSSRTSAEDKNAVVEIVSTWMVLPMLIIGLFVFTFPGFLINLFAPGLDAAGSIGLLERDLAKIQLQRMAPCVVSGALCGIGFGALNAARSFVASSLSPAILNIAMILYMVISRNRASPSIDQDIIMSKNLSVALVLGCICQTLFQAAAMHKERIGRFFYPNLKMKDFEIFVGTVKILIPATIASTMLQLATYTDLYFASSWPGAAAVITSASLLVNAPLGIISSVVTIPRVPTLSIHASQEKFSEFSSYLNSMIFLCIDTGLPLTISIIAFAPAIVKCVFERSAFTAASTSQVVPVLMVNSLGIVFFLTRDILIKAFYALDKKGIPPVVSGIALLLNVVLDVILCNTCSLPAVGLVLATVVVNGLSVMILLSVLWMEMCKHEVNFNRLWKRFAFKTFLCAAVTVSYTVCANKIAMKLHEMNYFMFLKNHLPYGLWVVNTMSLAFCFVSSCALYIIIGKLTERIARQKSTSGTANHN